MNRKLNIQNIIKLVDKILEYNYFKIVSISIITSFLLFNAVSYFKNDFFEKDGLVEVEPVKIKINIGNFAEKLEQLEDQTLVHFVSSGETLTEILLSLGSSNSDVDNILIATKEILKSASLFQGQRLVINYKTIIDYEDGDSQKNLVRKSIISKISLSPDPEIEITIVRQKDGSYKSTKIKKELFKKILKYSGTIENSLFVDGTQAGISPNIMIEMINLYGFAVDFQRDLRGGDRFEVLFEQYYDKEGNKVKDGNMLYSSLELKTKKDHLKSYLYKYQNTSEYFDEKGRSIKRSLLVTPINGARISSKFGMRRHPILGFKKKHKGLDFASPTGTPIFAAGGGLISKIGYSPANGNFIFIKHNQIFETVYIHMSRFARNMKKNTRVKQGQTIGYVGSTGLAKGPHLHYEVHKNGTAINPATFKGAANIILAGKNLKNFKNSLNEIKELLKRPSNNQN